MDTTPLTINVDRDVFKLKDPSIEALANGVISLERMLAFSNSYAPYVLLGDTLYALTEAEYYALVPGMYRDKITPNAFKWVLEHLQSLALSDDDKETIARIADTYETCSKCTYRRYKEVLLNMMHRYNVTLPAELDNSAAAEVDPAYVYPGTTEHIEPKASALMNFKVDAVPAERNPCLDCVEKHVSQALILGREALLGYPEHLILACGHLEEAIAETPEEADTLKKTLVFCLGKTKHDKVLFLPVHSILVLLQKARESFFAAAALKPTDKDGTQELFELECTDEIIAELKLIPEDLAIQCFLLLDRAENIAAESDPTDSARLMWEGAMASAADEIVQLAPKAANMLRNRRLLFVSDPRLMLASDFSLQPLMEALKR